MTSRFVWFDLNTKEPEKAKAFYPELFGWKIESWKPEGGAADMPPYTMFQIGEQGFGGMNAIPADAPAPSHWMGHVNVEDVDAAVARATKMGAQFPMGTMTVPSVGRMAMMVDPQGCVCSLYQPESGTFEQPPMETHGMVGWSELLAEDAEAAKNFYGEVVGWKCRKADMAAGMEYFLFGSGEEGNDAGGLMKKDDQMPVAAWFLYFTTTDIEKSVADVERLGGSVHAKPFAVPEVGDLAICAGPDGSMFGIAQWAPQG